MSFISTLAETIAGSPEYGPAGKPSIGRAVHFFGSKNGPYAADIVACNVNTGICDLFVKFPAGSPSICAVIPDAPFSAVYGTAGCWSWAPRV